MPSHPSHVTIHSLEQARAVLAEARRTGEAVILDSPVGAAGWQGIGWWQQMVARLKTEFAETAFDTVLDCGDQPGLALAALRAGVTGLRVEADTETLAKLTDIAAQTGAVLDCAAQAGAVLDCVEPAGRGSTGPGLPRPPAPSSAREIS